MTECHSLLRYVGMVLLLASSMPGCIHYTLKEMDDTGIDVDDQCATAEGTVCILVVATQEFQDNSLDAPADMEAILLELMLRRLGNSESAKTAGATTQANLKVDIVLDYNSWHESGTTNIPTDGLLSNGNLGHVA